LPQLRLAQRLTDDEVRSLATLVHFYDTSAEGLVRGCRVA
jgi:hypothetical protein